ncbi:sulfite exporter TauE/SafE family protein [Rhodomicrobium sp. Az07]|uniref:sulfite exporter TauE/SafE family protein n=1 Tax=Rhodomicrobium sp. Az07 TaxID=2839034 RepID=UPI001BE7A41B|nr:sulfite exporter TauE/SafE family protein [Rhodomicrobium sp. Az07]MBT3071221.1 sulfite exporter TauE/SafE family protein [Rhodomicrobium sp. Az07]
MLDLIQHLPWYQIAELAVALLIGGIITGFLAGLLGIGGGAVSVPVLYELFRLANVDESIIMRVCVATSLAIIIPTAINSVRSHNRHGAVVMDVIRRLGPWVVAGAVLGVFIASRAPSSFLKAVFAISCIFIASRLAFGKSEPKPDAALPPAPWNLVAGFGIGLISTLIGIGGGAYVTAYMKFLGWPIHQAVGTAAGFGPIIAIPATIGYMVEGWNVAALPPLSAGYVSLLGFLVLGPVSVLAAPLGARLAHRLSRRTLEVTFMSFLLFVAARFMVSLVWGV